MPNLKTTDKSEKNMKEEKKTLDERKSIVPTYELYKQKAEKFVIQNAKKQKTK